jgi:hypothetical protein
LAAQRLGIAHPSINHLLSVWVVNDDREASPAQGSAPGAVVDLTKDAAALNAQMKAIGTTTADMNAY